MKIHTGREYCHFPSASFSASLTWLEIVPLLPLTLRNDMPKPFSNYLMPVGFQRRISLIKPHPHVFSHLKHSYKYTSAGLLKHASKNFSRKFLPTFFMLFIWQMGANDHIKVNRSGVSSNAGSTQPPWGKRASIVQHIRTNQGATERKSCSKVDIKSEIPRA